MKQSYCYYEHWVLLLQPYELVRRSTPSEYGPWWPHDAEHTHESEDLRKNITVK